MAKQERVALFTTCIVDQLLPEVGVATVKLLRRAGCQVDYPAAQSCCGQPFYNSGFRRQAAELARQTIELLEPYPQIVLPSGSCTTMIRLEYPHLLADSPKWASRARTLGAKTYELSEFLVNKQNWRPDYSPNNTLAGETSSPAATDQPGITTKHDSPTVTYHDSCHMNRMLGVRNEPRELLEGCGCSLREMEESDCCCGFGGVFSVRMPEVSTAMTAEKLRLAATSGAQSVITADPGCLMQMRQLTTDKKLSIRHLAVVLEEMTR